MKDNSIIDIIYKFRSLIILFSLIGMLFGYFAFQNKTKDTKAISISNVMVETQSKINLERLYEIEKSVQKSQYLREFDPTDLYKNLIQTPIGSQEFVETLLDIRDEAGNLKKDVQYKEENLFEARDFLIIFKQLLFSSEVINLTTEKTINDLALDPQFNKSILTQSLSTPIVEDFRIKVEVKIPDTTKDISKVFLDNLVYYTNLQVNEVYKDMLISKLDRYDNELQQVKKEIVTMLDAHANVIINNYENMHSKVINGIKLAKKLELENISDASGPLLDAKLLNKILLNDFSFLTGYLVLENEKKEIESILENKQILRDDIKNNNNQYKLIQSYEKIDSARYLVDEFFKNPTNFVFINSSSRSDFLYEQKNNVFVFLIVGLTISLILCFFIILIIQAINRTK